MADRTTSWAQQEEERRTQVKTIVTTIDAQEQKYLNLLPGNVSWAKFRNAFLIAVQGNPRLLDADRQSLFLALQKAAGDGLLPDGREGAIVIYGDDGEDEDGNPVPSTAKGKKKCVWMPMVWGLCKAMRNTGNIKSIRCKVIYKGEKLIITDKDGEETYEHVRTINPEMSDDFENIIGAYAVVSYQTGGYDAEFMSRAQIDRRRRASKAKKGPWAPWYAEMAQKVPLRRLSNRVEKSAENERYFKALEHDETLATTTIEGEVVDESVEDIRGEFTAEKQAKPAETKAKPKQDTSAGGPPTATKHVAPSAKPAEVSEPKGGGDPAGANEATGVSLPTDDAEIWATDEFGEPVEQTEPMNGMEFANWFAAQVFVAKTPLALREHNADAIEQAGHANFKALGVIEQAWSRHLQRQQDDREATRAAAKKEDTAREDGTKQAGNGADPQGIEDHPATQAGIPVGQPAKAKRVPIPVPQTPKGAQRWPDYEKLAIAEIERLSTDEEIDDWVAINEPTYKNRVVEILVNNRLKKRREAIQIAGGRLETGTMFLTRVREEISKLKTEQEIVEWSRGAIRQPMMDLSQSDPDQFELAKNIIDQRRFDLENRP